jgi:hypothetical protein
MKGGAQLKNDDEIRAQLKALNPDDIEAVNALADRIKGRARQIPKDTTNMWLKGDESNSMKALEVLVELEELTIHPAIEAYPEASADKKARLMYLAVEQHLNVRKMLLKTLRQMLQDKSMVPQPLPIEAIEEPPVPCRFCDEAYILMRRLLNYSEDEAKNGLNSDAFLELPPEERDNEIQKALASKEWTIWVDDAEAQD